MNQKNIFKVVITKEPPSNTWCAGMLGRCIDVVDNGEYYLLAEDIDVAHGIKRGIPKDFAKEQPKPSKREQFTKDIDKLISGDYVLVPKKVQIPTFKIGDKVYCPEIGEGIYTVKSFEDSEHRFCVSNCCGDYIVFYSTGYTDPNRLCVWHATSENRAALKALYSRESFSRAEVKHEN